MDHASSNQSPRVVVLMSTYQGERFVRQQLQSILPQLPAGGQVIVRDDGSRDLGLWSRRLDRTLRSLRPFPGRGIRGWLASLTESEAGLTPNGGISTTRCA